MHMICLLEQQLLLLLCDMSSWVHCCYTVNIDSAPKLLHGELAVAISHSPMSTNNRARMNELGMRWQADFSFYYDIGGRRRCYIAPERFYEGSAPPPRGGLRPAMVSLSLSVPGILQIMGTLWALVQLGSRAGRKLGMCLSHSVSIGVHDDVHFDWSSIV